MIDQDDADSWFLLSFLSDHPVWSMVCLVLGAMEFD